MRKIKLFEQYNQLDDILDKISQKGINSLSDHEKEFLDEWTEEKEKQKIYEKEPFQIKFLEFKIDKNKVFDAVYYVEMKYKGEEYLGTISTKLNGSDDFFQWDLVDKHGNQIDIDADDFYELDDCVQEMTEDINSNQD